MSTQLYGHTILARYSVKTLRSRRLYSENHSYQKTLLLPKTKFSTRSNLQNTLNTLIPQSSQNVYKYQMTGFLNKLNSIESDPEKFTFVKDNLFVLQDGPPYANGDLHFGHALNKILKDIINRYQLGKGKHIFFRPGWDCHGLPIEMKALKEITADELEKISPLKIRSIAEKHAKKAVASQLKQFEQFGIMTDWKDNYITMKPKYEIDQLRVFQKMFNKGYIKRQNKPVFWGTETRTALAEGELEYNDNHVSTAAYVKFPLTKDSVKILKKNLSNNKFNDVNAIECLIWTSTPWTLFSNRAICINKNYNYSLVLLPDSLGNIILLATDLIEKVGLPMNSEILESITGSQLMDLSYTNPLVGDEVSYPLLHGDHVTNSIGTGLVHTAPGHGSDDYIVGIKNSIEIFSPIDHQGRFNLQQLPSHLHILLTNPANNQPRRALDSSTAEAVIDRLQKVNMLLRSHEYLHSYPYDWRSKKPIIIRATPQWFTDLKEVKELALKSLENVKFYPQRGKARLSSFIKNRNEWCISRQRHWGVPIPAFHRRDNPDDILISEEIVDHAINVISKNGINSWFSASDEFGSDMKEWLPSRYSDVAHEYFRGKDTMDVWFDSGTSWRDTESFYKDTLRLSETPEPLSDVYLEGSDQHRGWFQSSLLTKVAFSGLPVSPYKTLITHGFTLDENGIKMSKSIGNTISPKAIIEGDKELNLLSLGVDGLRYLVSQSNFTTDIVAGQLIMQHVMEAMKKFRLTFKFLLGNLQYSSFELLPHEKLRRVDMYIINSLYELQSSSDEHYQNYNFSKVLATIQYHMNNYLSAFYFDISKDSLYSDSIEDIKRKQIQSTLFYILDTYRAILSPILPILVQDVWNNLLNQWLQDPHKTESPMTRSWPNLSYNKSFQDTFKSTEMNLLKAFQAQFKLLGNDITKTEQTTVTIYDNGNELPFHSEEISDILKTANVEICPGKAPQGIESAITVSLSNSIKVDMITSSSLLHKCPRCWKSNSEEIETLCNRCEKTIGHK